MNLLSIIDKLYENDNFVTILIIAIVVLVILFIIVLILGLKDAAKSKKPKKVKEEEVKDITFEEGVKEPIEKEDVTFETPVLTKNLEDFKKSFEEEIQKDQDVEVRTTAHSTLSESTKPVKILDINVIEDTAVITPVTEEEVSVPTKEKDKVTPKEEKEEVKEEEKIITRDVDKKEIFKSKKEPVEEKIEDDKLHFIDDDEF